MLITSLLDTDVGMMPLAKVTDMRLHRTTLGHALGYAEFVIESAGQDQALSRTNFVPYPSQMYQEILSLIFSPKPQGGNGQGLSLDWLRGIAWQPVGVVPAAARPGRVIHGPLRPPILDGLAAFVVDALPGHGGWPG